jgi:putative transposase
VGVEAGLDSHDCRVLPLFKRRTKEVNALLPELYLHGLATGDFDLALRGLLGEEAPISANTVARLKEKWEGEFATWNARRLDDLEVTYLWADGVYVKAGLEKDKAAILVLLAGLSDGRKVILALRAGHRESEQSWASLLRDLKSRVFAVRVWSWRTGIWEFGQGLSRCFPKMRSSVAGTTRS